MSAEIVNLMRKGEKSTKKLQNYTLTPNTLTLINNIAKELNLYKNEVIERAVYLLHTELLKVKQQQNDPKKDEESPEVLS